MQKCLVVPNSVRCSEHGGCPLLGGCFYTISLCKLQSVPQGLSTVERQSASQRVHYGRLHCTQLDSSIISDTIPHYKVMYDVLILFGYTKRQRIHGNFNMN